MSDALPLERRLYAEIARRVQAGETVVRALLVRAWGSVPREVGAKMLVFADGSIAGTVGGGCGEAEVWQAAMEVHESGLARRVEVDLTEDQHSDSGKVCGGRFEVFLDVWKTPLLEGFAEALNSPHTSLLATALGPVPLRSWQKRQATPPFSPTQQAVHSWLMQQPDGRLWTELPAPSRARLLELDGHEYFLDPLTQGLELVIAGAGHIARPLSETALRCGYQVTVIDDRAEYARAQDFPGAKVVCQTFSEFFAQVPVHSGSHVVLVTRGHKFDEACLRQLAMRPERPTYVGMIGSWRRTRAVLDEMRQQGFDPQWLDEIRAPVGLDIGALTPEEISISILAEMILLRRGSKNSDHGGIPLSTPKGKHRVDIS